MTPDEVPKDVAITLNQRFMRTAGRHCRLPERAGRTRRPSLAVFEPPYSDWPGVPGGLLTIHTKGRRLTARQSRVNRRTSTEESQDRLVRHAPQAGQGAAHLPGSQGTL